MMKYYRMSLVISFVTKLEGDGGVDEDELWDSLSYIFAIEAAGKRSCALGERGECGERWNG